MDDAHYPFSAAQLARWRSETARRLDTRQLGGHLQRQKGQSLEFEDYRPYVPGDDVRHIDWRASARVGHRGELVVRNFRHESQLRVLVSIDNRPGMDLPHGLEKLAMARWIAASLACLLSGRGDALLAHRLFGPPAPPLPWRGRGGPQSALRWLRSLTPRDKTQGPAPSPAEVPNQRGLLQALTPTTLWIILSDFYFDDPGHRLRRLLKTAQERLCWVILMDLDSFSAETAGLAGQQLRVLGPGLAAEEAPRIRLDGEAVASVERRIVAHKQAFADGASVGGLSRSHWDWGSEARAADELFLRCWRTDALLAGLFRPPPW